MNRIGVVIVDGVGYRNFILSSFLQELKEDKTEVIIFSGLKKEVYDLEHFSNIKIIELHIYRENKASWVFRKGKELGHLQKFKHIFSISRTLQSHRNSKKDLRSLMNRFLIFYTSFFHSEKWINRFYKMQVASFKNNEVAKKYSLLLKENKCDLLFFTHQRPPYLAPLAIAAKKNNILTCSFIFSWDNLASKGRMAADFDYYVVWSDLMKEELLHFYPNTSEERAEVVGTPQFEPYVLPKFQTTKEDFTEKFNISADKKTICYSCGDVSTSKNDGLYIKCIAEAIIQKEIEDVNFIVRTAPAEDGSRFSEIKKMYPFIIWNFPKWYLSRENHPEPWSQRIPTEEDVKDLRALLEFSDLGINMCSTMSLDFMIFDKPVINPVFGSETNGLYYDQRFLKYHHYQKVVNSGAVYISKNKEELIAAIKEALANPQKQAKERQNLLNLQIGKPLKGTSKRILETLNKFSGK